MLNYLNVFSKKINVLILTIVSNFFNGIWDFVLAASWRIFVEFVTYACWMNKEEGIIAEWDQIMVVEIREEPVSDSFNHVCGIFVYWSLVLTVLGSRY